MPAKKRTGSKLDVVIAGGGVAALEAALAFRNLAAGEVNLTLLSPAEQFVYRPVAVLEPFAGKPPRGLALETFAAEIGASFVHDSVASVDPDSKVLVTGGEAELPYGALVVATGARAGAAPPGTAVVNVARMAESVIPLIDGIRERSIRSLCLVAPRRTWPLPVYELALLLRERSREPSGSETEPPPGADAEITVLTAEAAPLAVFGSTVSEALARLLTDAEIRTIVGSELHSAGGNLTFAPSGAPARFDRLVSMPELKGPAIPGLPADAGGFVPITSECAVIGVDRVYAAGDATDFPVKFGGIAAQQADTAASQIAATAGAGTEPVPFDGTVHGVLQCGWTPLEQLYFTAHVQRGEVRDSTVSRTPISSGAKIGARYLAPYLEARWAGAAGAFTDELSWEAHAKPPSSNGHQPQPATQ